MNISFHLRNTLRKRNPKTRNRLKRYLAFFMALNLFFEIAAPTMAMALTQGPFQPEFTSFEPAASSEMIDVFTGDFKYNIPLMDIDGYPINIAYHAGANMDQEATWVGLGWTLNAGAVNRAVKGLPDDFNGETLATETYAKHHQTIGAGGSVTKDVSGTVKTNAGTIGLGLGLSYGATVKYDNYRGYGIDLHVDESLSPSVFAGIQDPGMSAGIGANFCVGGGLTISSQDGGIINTYYSVGISAGFKDFNGSGMGASHAIGVGHMINSRTGQETNSYNSSTGVSFSFGKFQPSDIDSKGKFDNLVKSSVAKDEVSDLYVQDGVGAGTSHVVPAGSVAYNFRSSNSFGGQGFSFSAKLGFYGCIPIPIPGATLQLEAGYYFGLNGFYNEGHIVDNVQAPKAYGYMNLQNADEKSILDFNRTNDGSIYLETPNLPLSTHTYDLYTATAQGLYTNFRAHRPDAGIVYDNRTVINSNNTDVTGEVGLGVFAHFLLGMNTSNYSGTNGNWNSILNGSMKYVNMGTTDNREQSCFKSMGEMTATDDGYFSKINDENVSVPSLTYVGAYDVEALNPLAGASTSASTGGAIVRGKREIRSNNIAYLSGDQASKYGVEKQIGVYTANSFALSSGTRSVADNGSPESRTTLGSVNTSGHISEISLTQNNGAKYVYGTPIYNLSKKQVVFNASDQSTLNYEAKYEMINYVPSNDLGSANTRGLDNLYHSQTMPAYAQSHLLSAILSPDYVDITGNGPTYDDHGSYTKFNYSKITGYKWRAPYGIPSGNITNSGLPYKNWAALDKGLIADKFDDKAFYEYGSRDIRLLHSIETKNYVAYFYVSPRRDALGVNGEDGDVPTPSAIVRPSKLDKIELYSKDELLRAQQSGAPAAVPIKTVYFEYDYSLCPGVFNNDGATETVSPIGGGSSTNINSAVGKLTLKKIFFSYGSSSKGQLTPYEFVYADNDHNGSAEANYTYDPKAVDRWGNYKPNNPVGTGTSGSTNNDEFPYSEQNQSNADSYAAAWNLTTIYTPTSAVINVEYEADDYGYIQNETAGQMLRIVDYRDYIGSYNPYSPPATNGNIMNARYLILDLSALNTGIPTTLSSPDAEKIVRDKLLQNTKSIYFKCFTLLNGTPAPGLNNVPYWEYISGYADIDYSSVTVYSNGGSYYGYAAIRIKQDGIVDDGTGPTVSPITKAGWQLMRTHLPRIAYPGSEPNNMGGSNNPTAIAMSMIYGLGAALIDFVNGAVGHPNNRFYHRKYCSAIDYSKSWVRTYVPYKKKIGGGYRVKQIVTKDQWSQMVGGEATSYYGQKYTYTTVENKTTISSGVAQYEPLAGGDEISLRKPIEYIIPHRMAPDDHLLQEEPIGEMFYPAPLVGYSKVIVQTLNIASDGTIKTDCGIGTTEYNFYTAKDFPVIISTASSKIPVESDPIENYTIVSTYYKVLNAAQGYVIKLNDMHGKLKSQYVYGEGNSTAPISGAIYSYKQTSPGSNGKAQLIETAQTIDKNLVTRTEAIGKSVDVTTDMRESITTNDAHSEVGNLDINLCIGVSFGLGFSGGTEVLGAKSAVITKMVQQYGILSKVETFDAKSKTTMENVLWDRNTGDVVLTKTTNMYNAPVFSFKYPAYWMYNGMSGSYARQGLTARVQMSNSGSTTDYWNYSTGKLPPDVTGIMQEGDEVYLSEEGGTFSLRCWVGKSGSDYVLLDYTGFSVKSATPAYSGLNTSSTYLIRIIKPIERNLQSFVAGGVTSLNNPVSSNAGIIDASAIEYCNIWNSYITTNVDGSHATADAGCFPNGTGNMYISGYWGNWRPWRAFSYKTTRNYSTSQPNTRTDGTFQSYTPFWSYSSGWSPIYTGSGDYGRWVLQGENTIFSPDGNLAESKDALGLYHSQLYSNNHLFVKAKAANAEYREVAFDGFEEYLFTYPYMTTCGIGANDHMDMYSKIDLTAPPTPTRPFLTMDAAHTGRQSLQVNKTHSIDLSYALTNTVGNPINSEYPANCSSGYGCGKVILKNNGKYIVSFWVSCPDKTLTDLSSQFTFDVTNGGTSLGSGIAVKKTQVIDGWQKFEYTFTPGAGSPVHFIYSTPSGASVLKTYMDDIRIQPFNSSMTCYVYDPYQLRLWAVLDDRNYATIMEYDKEGMLVRSKKETEHRIFTINESRSAVNKQH